MTGPYRLGPSRRPGTDRRSATGDRPTIARRVVLIAAVKVPLAGPIDRVG